MVTMVSMVTIPKSNYAVIESEKLLHVRIVNRKKEKIRFTVRGLR